MENIKKALTISLLALLSSCYYDVEETLYPSLDCDTTAVTYSAVVLPIIQSKCYKCHDAANNFGNITLEGHANLKIRADNGQLLGAIKHQQAFSPMPKNEPQLVECDIAKIEAWVLAGALQN